MYKLVFFVPSAQLEKVKLAVFEAGAGKIGDYEHCAWQTLGYGQFRPLAGSNAFIGKVGEVEVLEEYRVELVCEDAFIQGAVQALKSAHPYEEPAYDVLRLTDEFL